MYSQTLREIADSISSSSSPEEVHRLIDRGMLCYLDSIAQQINGNLIPQVNRSDVLTQTSLISSVTANNPQLPNIEKLHYLTGMILEQQGALIARDFINSQMDVSPAENDYWYLLTLSFLHYLAGGHRIQALTIVKNLSDVLRSQEDASYKKALNDIKDLFSGQFDYDHRVFFIKKEKIKNLISQVRANTVANLEDLGLSKEAEWLRRRKVKGDGAVSFWKGYLQGLFTRGITTFTKEQINNDFDSWLRTDNDLLVVLPTGSGKTIVGELKTALTLADGKQVVWLLPMRSLVRQTQSEMTRAFANLGITVQELPITDDFFPLFTDISFTEPMVAITTPEKFFALIRINDAVLNNIGLIVVDEAQNLFENRGFAIESDLLQVTSQNPDCRIIFLSAMADKAPKLIDFYNRLRKDNELTKIISPNRPTRCSYGVFTSFQDATQYPAVVCYPALESETERISYTRIISLPKTRARKSLATSDLVRRFVKHSQNSSLRSIIFVNRKDSTEARARNYSNDREEISYPEDAFFDLARVKVERGIDSPFDEAFKHGVAPHHGSLPRIEQIFIEKWIRRGFIKQVIATPTLAQGVNLPFDISIITFLTRHDDEGSEELSQAEVINMLGRAGRAGMVSDGLALIAQQNRRGSNDARQILDDYKRWFFHGQIATDRFIGLSSILRNLLKSTFDVQDWIEELRGLNFSEATSLNVLLSRVYTQVKDGDFEGRLREDISKYPSINDLQDQVDPNQDVSAFFAKKLLPIIINFSSYSLEILNAMAFTGLPAEYIDSVISDLRSIDLTTIDQLLDFANSVVERGLLKCNSRDWFIRFCKLSPSKSFEFAEGFSAVKKWMSGNTWHDISREFNDSFDADLIYTGSFLNNALPQLAQFWGCLAVCEKIIFGSESHHFDFLQPFVRNGVNSREKLIVLKEIGFNDRVLAHRLVQYFDLSEEDSIADLQKSVRLQLKVWKADKGSIPADLGLDELMALKSILVDLYIP